MTSLLLASQKPMFIRTKREHFIKDSHIDLIKSHKREGCETLFRGKHYRGSQGAHRITMRREPGAWMPW